MIEKSLTGIERQLTGDEIIVSKTDLRGRITYCNDVFVRLAGFTERELLGAPHSIIRHPRMPRCVFKLLWDTLEEGREIFAYVVNRAKNGDHYWVLAHVTPDIDHTGTPVGYHSNRRSVTRDAVAAVESLYKRLLDEEGRHADPKAGMSAGEALLNATLADKDISYERFILSL